jgi:hypothetical protein
MCRKLLYCFGILVFIFAGPASAEKELKTGERNPGDHTSVAANSCGGDVSGLSFTDKQDPDTTGSSVLSTVIVNRVRVKTATPCRKS